MRQDDEKEKIRKYLSDWVEEDFRKYFFDGIEYSSDEEIDVKRAPETGKSHPSRAMRPIKEPGE